MTDLGDTTSNVNAFGAGGHSATLHSKNNLSIKLPAWNERTSPGLMSPA